MAEWEPGIQEGKRIFFVISHTHWDREWYYPFQRYRLRLVGLIDSLIELMDSNPEYKYFMLDGQSAPIDDYLEVRPKRRPAIERLVKEGRLLVGPWWVPPDEWVPGGEAHIRNILRGVRLAESLGAVMMVGYQADDYGHVAHLPAILQGFGIDSAVVWRGIPDEVQTSEFIWRSPDGSELLTLWLPWSYGWQSYLPDAVDDAVARIKEFSVRLEAAATTPIVALMDGMDHSPPRANLPELLEKARREREDAEYVHATYPLLFAAIRQAAAERGIELPVFEGEMRCARRTQVLPGALSSRMWIKQRNQHLEDELTRFAEPLTVWWSLLRRKLGARWREPLLPKFPLTRPPVEAESLKGVLRGAWRFLIDNQEHDAIYGASIDPVHREMVARFDSCEQISDDLVDLGLLSVAAQVDTGGEVAAVVYNPLAGPRTDFVTIGWPQREDGLEPVAFEDGTGRCIACQVTTRPPLRYMSYPGMRQDNIEVSLLAADVPGHGYKVFRPILQTRVDAAESRTHRIENEHFEVTVDENDGTVSLREKATGNVLRGLNRFQDEGDRGDEYSFWALEQDTVVDSPAAIAVHVEAGPARSLLEIDLIYRLPAGLSENRENRSKDIVDYSIRSSVSLYPGVRRVDFHTEVENNAKDHRLRVLFPTGLKSRTVRVEQHFGVVERGTELPEYDQTWEEDPVNTQPQKSFVDVSDGRKGVMIANRGLPEYEALRDDGGSITLALTLLRCCGWLCRGDMTTRRYPAGPVFYPTPEAQCMGSHSFDYSILVHEGGWQEAFVEAHRFAVPMKGRAAFGSGSLPAEASLVEVSPSSAILAALKFAEDDDSVIARLYNIADDAVQAKVRLLAPHRGVEIVDLNERYLAAADVRDGAVHLSLRRNEIVSLRFTAGE